MLEARRDARGTLKGKAVVLQSQRSSIGPEGPRHVSLSQAYRLHFALVCPAELKPTLPKGSCLPAPSL